MDSKEYLKSAYKLKKDEDLTLKDKVRFFMSCKSTLREELEDIEGFDKELKQKNDLSKRAFYGSIFRVKSQVLEVKSRLESFVSSTKSQGIGPDYEFTVNNLQKSADVVNSEILQFKEKSRLEYEELCQAEKILDSELEYFSNKFTQWETEIPKTQKPSMKSYKNPTDLPPLKQELVSIEKEIEDFGGQNLGWDDADHTEFLRVWHKNKSKATPGFYQAVANALPLHDLDSIKEHLNKYLYFLSLNDKKKEVLQKWRDEKLNIRPSEQETEEKKEKTRPISATAAKQKLEEWRNNREKLKEEESERKKFEEEKRREIEFRQKTLREEKRQMVLEFKEKKEFEKAKTNLITEYVKKREKIELSEEDKQRLKEREDRLVEQKRVRTLAQMKSHEDNEKAKSLNKLKSQAQWAHVDSKLNEETFAVKARKEAKREEFRAQTFGGMLVHRPTRAMPGWRAGL